MREILAFLLKAASFMCLIGFGLMWLSGAWFHRVTPVNRDSFHQLPWAVAVSATALAIAAGWLR